MGLHVAELFAEVTGRPVVEASLEFAWNVNVDLKPEGLGYDAFGHALQRGLEGRL